MNKEKRSREEGKDQTRLFQGKDRGGHYVKVYSPSLLGKTSNAARTEREIPQLPQSKTKTLVSLLEKMISQEKDDDSHSGTKKLKTASGNQDRKTETKGSGTAAKKATKADKKATKVGAASNAVNMEAEVRAKVTGIEQALDALDERLRKAIAVKLKLTQKPTTRDIATHVVNLKPQVDFEALKNEAQRTVDKIDSFEEKELCVIADLKQKKAKLPEKPSKDDIAFLLISEGSDLLKEVDKDRNERKELVEVLSPKLNNGASVKYDEIVSVLKNVGLQNLNEFNEIYNRAENATCVVKIAPCVALAKICMAEGIADSSNHDHVSRRREIATKIAGFSPTTNSGSEKDFKEELDIGKIGLLSSVFMLMEWSSRDKPNLVKWHRRISVWWENNPMVDGKSFRDIVQELEATCAGKKDHESSNDQSAADTGMDYGDDHGDSDAAAASASKGADNPTNSKGKRPGEEVDRNADSNRANNDASLRLNKNERIRSLEEAASRGDVNAMYELGSIYANGDGVPKNMTDAIKWWTKAADGGHLDAMYELGMNYYHYDPEESRKWLEKAANGGHVEAKQRMKI